MGNAKSKGGEGGDGGAGGGGGEGGGAAKAKTASKGGKAAAATFQRIEDKYETLDEVSDALRTAGLESSNLIIAFDFTKSTQWTGRKVRGGCGAIAAAYTPPRPNHNLTTPSPPPTPHPRTQSFGGRCLHWLDPEQKERNPFVKCTETIGRVLAQYDDDNKIPAFGFGDSTTLDRAVFPFFHDRPANGFEEVLARYKELVPKVIMAGPTNFAPAIDAACAIVAQTRMYHILLIIADGQVTSAKSTEAAIVRASEQPLSIVVVGVGDGPWDAMDDFDDNLPSRHFDNFQFVNATKVWEENPHNPDVAFAIAALMEIPEQYMAIRKLGYLG